MATVIRFSRHGTKKKPFYKIVVQDHRSPRDGKFIEKIGSFDPVNNDALSLSRERMSFWLGTGAQLSDSVRKRVRPQLREWGLLTQTVSTPASSDAAPAPKKTKSSAPKSEKASKKTKSKEA